MSKVGNIYVFNCMPDDIYLALNGKNVRDVLPAFKSDGKTGGPGTMATPFARISADSIDGVAQFATNNTLEVTGDNVNEASYTIKIDPTDYDIDNDLALYIFDRNAVLITSTNGKVFTGDMLTPS